MDEGGNRERCEICSFPISFSRPVNPHPGKQYRSDTYMEDGKSQVQDRPKIPSQNKKLNTAGVSS